MKIDARQAALTVLERCRRGGAWSDAALSSVVEAGGLDRRDAALAARLCYGVLQNTALCDFYIDCYSNTKSAKLEPKVMDILRLGVYQLLFLDKIPARAAVSEAVRLSKELGYSRASGLINAVLRKISDNRENLPDIPGRGTAGYLAVRHSHPEWLVSELMDLHGYAFTEEFLAANNATPSSFAQINTLKTDLTGFEEAINSEGLSFIRHSWMPDCAELSGDIGSSPAFRAGLYYIQDPAARLAVMAGGISPGMDVLDACAAPGGKSFAAAIQMLGDGRILSCDINEKKLEQIRAGARRLGVSIITAKSMDAKSPDTTLTAAFDVVLADVPCSGMGVIRKKPDIRMKSKDDLSGLPEVQLDILRGVSGCVKPGGALIYSTCTVRRYENEDVVGRFLAEADGFAAEPFGFDAGYPSSDTGMLTLWPHIDGTDGFFIAKLRKQDEN